MSTNKERLDEMEKKISQIKELDSKMKELKLQHQKNKDLEMDLLTLKIANKKKEIEKLKDLKRPKSADGRPIRHHRITNSHGEPLEGSD